MNRYLILAIAFSSQFANAGGGGGGGGVRPQSFYSLNSKDGVSIFAVGRYENLKWKVEKVSMPSNAIPKQVSAALEKSEVTKNWEQIQE